MSTMSQETKLTSEQETKDSDLKVEEMISTMKREHDSTDDFERVDPENLFAPEVSQKEEASSAKELEKEEGEREGGTEQRQKSASPPLPATQPPSQPPRVQDSVYSMDSGVHTTEQLSSSKRSLLEQEQEEEERVLPATPPPSADIEKYNSMADPFQRPAGKTTSAEVLDSRAATIAFVETERTAAAPAQNAPANSAENTVLLDFSKSTDVTSSIINEPKMNFDQSSTSAKDAREKEPAVVSSNLLDFDSFEPTPPVPVTKVNTEIADLLSMSNHETFVHGDENVANNDKNIMGLDDRRNVQESGDACSLAKKDKNDVHVNDIVKEAFSSEPMTKRKDQNDEKTANFPAKSDSKAASAKTSTNVPQDAGQKDVRYFGRSRDKVQDIEIAPKEIFRDMGLDAWFNPERLNPRVATLIYWRDPTDSGAVFGATLGLLLSLAYFSLISVLAYLSLSVLIITVAFRIYKSVLQAIQKTSDGHPFKYILDLDLTLPNEKVHEIVDVAVAHVNATVSELRRLFLVEDIVDSLKFGVVLWCFTYIGSWFNGMTLIIIGVVALFTLPKVYETNKTQIDENMAVVLGKIDEFTTKIKAAIPLVNKPEPTKED